MTVATLPKPPHGAPSLSKSALLLSPCLTWAGAQARWYDEAYTGDSADMNKRDKGTLFHQTMDNYMALTVLTPTDQPDVNVWLDHAVRYLQTVLGPRCDTIQSEVAIGVNWITGEAEIQKGVKDRAYIRKPGWQYGTADLVCVLKAGELLIADWKTGGNDGATEQLLSLGAAFQKAMPGPHNGPTRDLKPRGLITLCLQVNEDGVWPHEKSWTNDQVQSHWDSMRFKWEDVVSGNTGEPKPGIHCTTLYCAHLAYCSAIQSSVLGLAESDSEGGKLMAAGDLIRAHRVTDTPGSDEEAGFTMAILSAAKRQGKYMETRLKEYIKSGGSVIQGGYVWSDGSNGHRWRKQ